MLPPETAASAAAAAAGALGVSRQVSPEVKETAEGAAADPYLAVSPWRRSSFSSLSSLHTQSTAAAAAATAAAAAAAAAARGPSKEPQWEAKRLFRVYVHSVRDLNKRRIQNKLLQIRLAAVQQQQQQQPQQQQLPLLQHQGEEEEMRAAAAALLSNEQCNNNNSSSSSSSSSTRAVAASIVGGVCFSCFQQLLTCPLPAAAAADGAAVGVCTLRAVS